MAKENNSVTGRQMLEMLREMDDADLDQPIHFAMPSHDHWGTEIAGQIQEIEVGRICWSAYHNAFRTIDEDRLHDHGHRDEETGDWVYDHQVVSNALIIK